MRRAVKLGEEPDKLVSTRRVLKKKKKKKKKVAFEMEIQNSSVEDYNRYKTIEQDFINQQERQ